jgi:methylmalonyl-CoA mutase N-terminal domain/subunit
VGAYVPSSALVERVAAGEVPAIARMISRAEAAVPEARAALAEIYRRAGRAHVIGVTGVPGSGKSTLVGKLAERLRAGGGKVGIVAVDPSSPYSGGAILGDRIRMSDLTGDPGIFIRSMATRGAVGGLARATLDAVDILDVAGYDTIVIETVGVGQDEVKIARASHTTVVVSAPGLGDEIQAIKAGILEIADIHATLAASEVADWEAKEVAAFLKKQPERREQFFTIGGIPLRRVYTEADLAGTAREDIGLPGRYPFTRGPYPTMYRSRVWTMRQIAGFGTAEDTNARFRYLISQGQTGISTDFDMPTLMGYDSDHPMSDGEVGREGVAVDTLADMEALLEGIDIENISVSLTINPTAWILLAMYIAVAEKRGCDLGRLSGTVQADILKEYMAQKEYVYPIAPSVRIVRNIITYCARNLKRYNPINISGCHISEAGASPLHEAAFSLANLIVYVEEVMKTGMKVDEFAPRLAFFFVSQGDFFEEIAKFRALRRCYAKIMKERFGATSPESMRLRFQCQTAAATLTKPQPMVNLMRTAFQALSAVLGGCQSLHTNGYDEAFAIPTEEAMRLALRTQQVIAEETNVTNVIDPLGGAYFVEALTTEYEKRIFAVLEEIDRSGGTVRLIEEGWFQKHIADFAYDTALRKQSGDKTVIGVNRFVDEAGDDEVETHPYDPTTAERQIARTRRVRRERDQAEIARLLGELVETARDESRSIMPVTISLVKAGATMGDLVETLKTVWGSYRENPVF